MCDPYVYISLLKSRHKIHTNSLNTKLYTLITDQIRKGGFRKDLLQRDVILITVETSQHFFGKIQLKLSC